MLDALQSIATAFSLDVERVARHTKRDAVLLGVIALLGLTAYVAGIGAIAIYSAEYFGMQTTTIIIFLAAILTMLVVIAALRFMQLQDERAAARAGARTKLVSVLGTALLPVLLKSRTAGAAAIIGGIAYAANEFLKSASDRPKPARLRRHNRPRRPPRVNGAINPYMNKPEQESLR